MKGYRPVEIHAAAFSFCKYSLALLFWAAWILHAKVLVGVVLFILLLSAWLGVQQAPLVLLYTHTFNRFIPSQLVLVDANAVRFAHLSASIFTTTALLFLYFISPLVGWAIIGLMAIFKTSGALGFCGAMKLYECMNNPNGQCCRFGNKLKDLQCETRVNKGGKP